MLLILILPNLKNFFVRNNGLLPSLETIKERLHKGWTLEIDGESIINKKSYTIEDLKKKFKTYTYALTVECGGNGRSEVIPSTKGTQWGYGAVACGRWTGVRLKDILKIVASKMMRFISDIMA